MHAYFWHSVRSSKSAMIYIMITVDLVIFGCLISHEFFSFGDFSRSLKFANVHVYPVALL